MFNCVRKPIIAVASAFIILLTTLCVSGAYAADEPIVPVSDDVITVTPSEAQSYKIIFAASDGINRDSSLAAEISAIFADFDVFMTSGVDVLEKETANEILLGTTNRALSASLADEVNKRAKDGSLVWCIAEENGKIAYLASSEDAFIRGEGDLLALFSENGITIERGARIIFTLSLEEYEEEKRLEEEKKEEEKLDALRETNDAFQNSQFYYVDTENDYNLPESDGGKTDNYPLVGYGETVTVDKVLSLPTDSFPAPHAYPSVSEHPYFYFTKEYIDDLKRALDHPDLAAAKKQLFEYADTKDFTGIMPEGVGKSGRTYRWSHEVCAILEAKAFAYVLTGDEKYALEAIIGAKNAMLSVKVTIDLHTDACNMTNRLMDIVTKVFDWCYDVMDEEDKLQITLGVQNRLFANASANLFRKAQGLANSIPTLSSVSGHGTGSQFIRKFVNMSLVFYTEEPTWWEFIGGKYFSEYVNTFIMQYNGNFASQGTANEGYGPAKFCHSLSSAFAIYTATGYMPEHAMPETNIANTAYYFYSHLTGENRYFTNGDGPRPANGSPAGHQTLLWVASMYGDSALYNAARLMSNEFSVFDYTSLNEMTVPMTIILTSHIPDSKKAEYQELGDGVELIQHFGYPGGLMTARDKWGPDGASVYMKIGEITMANHDLADHGTFQIHYKGLLAGVSGSYNMYGSYVHKYYLQATVSSNGILVLNPSKADDEPVYGKNPDGSDNKDVITNHERYYYSGGQRQLAEAGTLDKWLDGTYNMGKVTGAKYEYYKKNTPHYAYISGDLTAAYPGGTAEYIERSMLTIFTDDEEAPMFFIVKDSVKALGEDFKKTFLLHTVKEPTVSEDGKQATVSADLGGKLSVNLISGAEKITKIGGEGYAYWVNGKNCTDQYATSDRASVIWGRLEIETVGNSEGDMLVAMYVYEGDDPEIEIKKAELQDGLIGVSMNDRYAVFSEGNSQIRTEVTFTSGDKGLCDYYVCGIAPGVWRASIDGVMNVTLEIDESEAFAHFIGPRGNVTLTPISGIALGKINYELSGGRCEVEPPYKYYEGSVIELPIPVKSGAEFAGWFTSKDYAEESRVTVLDASTLSGNVTVYAKWSKQTLFDLKFDSDHPVDLGSSNSKTLYGINFGTKEMDGVEFKTVQSGDGEYLLWTKGPMGSYLYSKQDELGTISSTPEGQISYEITLSKDGDRDPIAGHIRIMPHSPATGKMGDQLMLLTLQADGSIRLGSTGAEVANLSDGEIHTLRLVIDFEQSKLRFYDALGNATASLPFKAPKVDLDGDGTKDTVSAEVFKYCLTQYLFYWYSNGSDSDQALRLYSVKIQGSDVFAKEALGRINYELFGGTSKEPLIYSYGDGEVIPLPDPEKAGAVFGGWYTSPDYDETSRVTVLDAKELSGDVTVYAKWLKTVLFDVEFDENHPVNVTTSTKNAHGINFGVSEKPGASFVTVGEGDNQYLVWTKGSKDSHMSSKESTFGTISSVLEDQISYEIKLSKDGDKDMIAGHVRIMPHSPTTGKMGGQLRLLTFVADGSVKLGLEGAAVADLSDGEIHTLRLVIDFALSELRYYDGEGNVTARLPFTAPEVDIDGDGSTDPVSSEVFKECMTQYLFYWYSNSQDAEQALRLYSIRIQSSDVFKKS